MSAMNFGSYSQGNTHYGSRTPGYGTSWGTNFNSGVGQYPVAGKQGFSKKALGLGVGAGFLGGAALGVGGTMATYGAMHKYKEFKRMMAMKQHHRRPSVGVGFDDDDYYDDDGYYRKYYVGGECYQGCPPNSRCEYSFCECNYGYEKRYGQCLSTWGGVSQAQYRPQGFDPFKQCMSHTDCQQMDMNLICNTEKTTGPDGVCECRRDMRWNTDALECQMYLDVDCSGITYDTRPSAAVQSAVEEAQRGEMPMIGEGVMLNRTETPQETMDKSLLKHMNVEQASEADLLEAYCRDIDAYSFDLNTQRMGMNSMGGTTKKYFPAPETTAKPMYEDPERPGHCDQPPEGVCASVFKTKDCVSDSNWQLDIAKNAELRFKWRTPHYAYKNAIELVAVRPGCTLKAWDKNDFSGETADFVGDGQFNKWVSLADDETYQKLNNRIQSVKCSCA